MEVCSEEEAKMSYDVACESMSRLNRNAAVLMHKYGAHSATDITGFGLLGHANNLAQNQKASIVIEITKLPIIYKMKEVAEKIPWFSLMEGYSAETSGGLFICIPASVAQNFMDELVQLDKQPAWIVGRCVVNNTGAKNFARIVENVEVIEVKQGVL